MPYNPPKRKPEPPKYEDPEMGEFTSLRVKLGEDEIEVTGREAFINAHVNLWMQTLKEKSNGPKTESPGENPGS